MDRSTPEYGVWTRARLDAETLRAAQHRVAILALPQASLTNVAAVFEDLQGANTVQPRDRDRPRFAPRIVAADPRPRPTLSGMTLTPHGTLDDTRYDAVVLPTLYDDGSLSGSIDSPFLTDAEKAWLQKQHGDGATVSTMCSGAYPLAEAGLLDGHDAAMHRLYEEPFRTRYPKVRVLTRRSLVVSGERRELLTGGESVYSSDVSLYLIARFCGAEVAMRFARLYGRSWSETLHEGLSHDPAEIDDRVIALARRFILDHLTDPAVVRAAASMTRLNPRTFTRRFTRATGLSPREFVSTARIERARDLLTRSRMPIEDVAARLGYSDRAAFAKTFRAKTGVTPAEYRARFQGAARLA